MEWRHRIVSLFINVDRDKDTNNPTNLCIFFARKKVSCIKKVDVMPKYL